MADIAHKLTEQQLADLEQEIADVYKQAAKELEKTIEDYFKQFEQRDAEMKKLVESGEVTKEHYTQWRLNQIGRGKRFEAMRDEVAKRYTKANSAALAYVNDRTPGIYSLNRSYEAFRIGDMAGVDFAAWDEQTVRRMIVKHPETMPYYPKKKALKRGIDLEYGKSYISKSTTSGILRGLSPYQIADELQVGVQSMNRTSAVRAARTAITSAQNGGRMDSYREAAEMGIEVKRMWMATLDGRTRHEHRLLDGQIRALDEPFSVEGEEIMFPGDASASPSMVYNCRCTLVPKVGKYGRDMTRRARDEDGRNEVIEYKTWSAWAAAKRKESGSRFDIYLKKTARISSDRTQFEKYRSILGAKVPKTLEAFQELKYNKEEEWNALKRAYADRKIKQDKLRNLIGESGKPYTADARDKFRSINQKAIKKTLGGFCAFPEKDALSQIIMDVAPEKGFYDVAMHGMKDAVCIGTKKANASPRLLAQLIMHQEDYNGQAIRLLACSTGDESDGICFAEELANALGVNVKAPNGLLCFLPKTSERDVVMYVGTSGDGKFITFKPNERGRKK